MVIVMPILVALMLLVVLSGRLTDARSDVVGAAAEAARAASLQHTGPEAQDAARTAAEDAVAGERINCVGGPQVTTTFDPQFGRGATVHVVVRCTVHTRDLTSIGVPVDVTLHEDAWEVVDTHRSL
jgi:Flp pilus assembly protein TadG